MLDYADADAYYRAQPSADHLTVIEGRLRQLRAMEPTLLDALRPTLAAEDIERLRLLLDCHLPWLIERAWQLEAP